MSDAPGWVSVHTADGRRLEVLASGPPDLMPLVFHSGTPSGPAEYPAMTAAAAAVGFSLMTYGRPGYGESDPKPGRLVADAAADVRAILDHFDAAEFVTLGWSGGGPHALACAALDKGCRAVATIAGAAPFDADGLDWMEGMGPENIEETAISLDDPEGLSPYLEDQVPSLADVRGEQVASALGGLVSPVDVAALTGAYAERAAASFRKSVSTGIAGWRDDDFAFIQPWGFDLADIEVPVAVWQGGEDLMVPYAHGRWLAEHIPTARPHLLPEHGHLSLVVGKLPAIIADLADLAALVP